MVDDRDDGIFELTEEMTSAEVPVSQGGGSEGAVETEVEPSENKGDSSELSNGTPFRKIADPKPTERRAVSTPDPNGEPPSRPSYIPTKSQVAVVTSPIKILATDSTPPSPPAASEPDEKEEILDLADEMVVDAPEDTESDVDSVVLVDGTLESEVDVDGEPVSIESTDQDGPDLGTPEAVFDTTAEEEDIPEESDDDVEEELDLADAEEVTEGSPTQVDSTDEDDAPITAASPGRLSYVSGSFPRATRHPKMRKKRRRPKEWWEDIFDDDYLSLLPDSTNRDLRRQTDAIENGLNVKKGSLILDLACGDGRHAVQLAKRGYRMVGVDLSLPMLAKAGETAQEESQEINFIHGDMRDLGFESTFDGVYCVGTSFGYFDEQTNYKVLEGIARALKPGAPFFMEVANRDHAIVDQPNLTWFQGNGSVCMEETTVNYLNSRLKVVRQLIMGDNSRQTKHEISIRLYSLHELGAMFTAAGFAVSRISGNNAAPGAFFGLDSPLIIVSASRRK